MATRQTWLGGTALIAIVIAGIAAASGAFSSAETAGPGLTHISSDIARWLSGSRMERTATSSIDIVLAPFDPILMQEADGQWRQIGIVRNHFVASEEAAATKQASVLLDERVLTAAPHGFHFRYCTTPTNLSWVADTLLPPTKQAEIAALIAAEWKTHRTEIVARLQPLVEGSLQIAVKEIESALPEVLQRHRGEFGKLADRYQSDIVRGQIVPLVKTEILPIVEEEFRPLANSLGRDIWNRVSVWAFTWRFLYDVSPLPERNTVQQEFDRFIAEEVLPAMEARSEEFVAVTERVLARISRNDKVRSVIRTNLRTVASDPELHGIVWSVVQEALVGNENLRQSLQQYWSSSEVQDAVQLTSSRFEPVARKIGDMILGNREDGVTPEFARVLRSQILLKDRRWLVLVPNSAESPVVSTGPITIEISRDAELFPLEFRRSEQSPLTKSSE